MIRNLIPKMVVTARLLNGKVKPEYKRTFMKAGHYKKKARLNEKLVIIRD